MKLLRIQFLKIKGQNRAASEIIGVLLIMLMMMATISFILSYSTPLINNMQSSIVMRNSIPQMVQLRDQTLLVTSGIIHRPNMVVSSSKGTLEIGSNSFDITIRDGSGIKVYETTASLRNIEFSHRDSFIAVENGGVWKKSLRGSAIMVEPPKIKNSDGNITIALIEYHGGCSASGNGFITTEFKLESKTTFKFEEGGTITMEIDSDYQDAWMRYLEHEDFNVNGNIAIRDFDRLILTEYIINVEMTV